MKKEYMQPTLTIVDVELTEMLAVSIGFVNDEEKDAGDAMVKVDNGGWGRPQNKLWED